MKIGLLWPDSRLNPNRKTHWGTRARLNNDAKGWAILSVKAITLEQLDRSKKYRVSYLFYPPDKHMRDLDNIEAACKSTFDGVAQALGIDDSQIKLVDKQWGNVIKGGMVIYEIEKMG